MKKIVQIIVLLIMSMSLTACIESVPASEPIDHLEKGIEYAKNGDFENAHRQFDLVTDFEEDSESYRAMNYGLCDYYSAFTHHNFKTMKYVYEKYNRDDVFTLSDEDFEELYNYCIDEYMNNKDTSFLNLEAGFYLISTYDDYSNIGLTYKCDCEDVRNLLKDIEEGGFSQQRADEINYVPVYLEKYFNSYNNVERKYDLLSGKWYEEENMSEFCSKILAYQYFDVDNKGKCTEHFYIDLKAEELYSTGKVDGNQYEFKKEDGTTFWMTLEKMKDQNGSELYHLYNHEVLVNGNVIDMYSSVDYYYDSLLYSKAARACHPYSSEKYYTKSYSESPDFDVNDYDSPDDFWDDHESDFEDYEEAEDYWNDYN